MQIDVIIENYPTPLTAQIPPIGKPLIGLNINQQPLTNNAKNSSISVKEITFDTNPKTLTCSYEVKPSTPSELAKGKPNILCPTSIASRLLTSLLDRTSSNEPCNIIQHDIERPRDGNNSSKLTLPSPTSILGNAHGYEQLYKSCFVEQCPSPTSSLNEFKPSICNEEPM